MDRGGLWSICEDLMTINDGVCEEKWQDYRKRKLSDAKGKVDERQGGNIHLFLAHEMQKGKDKRKK